MKSDRVFSQIGLLVLAFVTTTGFLTYNGVNTYQKFQDQEFLIQGYTVWMIFLISSLVMSILGSLILNNYFQERQLHQISSLIMCAVTCAVVIPFIRNTNPTTLEAISLGLIWSVCFILFEIIQYVVLQDAGINKLIQDYNIMDGKLLGLLSLVQLVLPPVIASMSIQ